MNARIEVEYYAAKQGSMQLRYDGTSERTPHYSGGADDEFWGGHECLEDYELSSQRRRVSQRPIGRRGFLLVANCAELYVHSGHALL